MNVCGSLFSGCLGLDLGLEAAGWHTAWYVENDDACRRVIARHRPGVPVIGDVREVDAGLPPVDLLAGGFPCQDMSYAGRGLGFAGDRSVLWFEFARAVRVLRPRLVLVENVPGLATRGLGRVLYDLAEAGYVGSWVRLRAADIGAPHGRERIFVLAADADDGAGHRERPRQEPRQRGEAAPDPASGGRGRRSHRHAGDGAVGEAAVGGEGFGVVAGGADVQAAADAGLVGRGARAGLRGGDARGDGRRLADDDGGEAAADAQGDAGRERDGDRETSPDADSAGGEARDAGSVRGGGDAPAGRLQPVGRDGTAWGVYEPAIRRWEHLFRPAPPPVDDRGRLSPRFEEWMLGFPNRWTEGEKRTSALRMLGNAVQVQCGEVVGRELMGHVRARAAA